MKKIILVILLFSVGKSYALNEKSITQSDITDVKVFLSGAQVSRTFKATVQEGITRLAIENLSSQIDRNSITVSASGDAMILSTSYSLDYLKEKRITPELKKLRDSLEILTGDMNELNMYESVYNDEVGLLNANKSVGGSNVGLSAENLQKVINFFRQRMTELKGKIMDIDKKQLKLNEKIKRINEQIEVENGKMNQPSGTIFVNLSSKQTANVNFELSYYAQGASWRPTYDLRAKDVKSQVNLLYKANVTQNTGENWNNVHVSLSTGNPTLGGNKPQLQPWYLRFYTPVYRMEGAAMERSPKTMSMDAVQAPSVPSLSQEVQVEENQIVTEFDIKIPYTVLSDGKEVMMDIQSYSLPATFSYYSSPKLDKDAFLAASITGWEKLNLLPGNSNVYLENSYVGESFINPSAATDTLQLSFGRDKRILISREKVKDMNTVKFIGGNVEKEFLFETTVRNSKKDNVSITIDDQVPLSTDASIKISTGELSNGNYNIETGLISWKIELKPGESKKIRLGYKVKYPKDKVIGGL
jgi:uncharacterized protein (TIGR02231 family)